MIYPTPTYRNTNQFVQIGTALGTLGAGGNVVVNLPVSYTTATSYVAMASHNDTAAGLRFSIVQTSRSSFTIYWVGGGATTQAFSWFTTGS